MTDVPDELALDFHLFADGQYVRSERVNAAGDEGELAVVDLGGRHTQELRSIARQSFAVIILDPTGYVPPMVIGGRLDNDPPDKAYEMTSQLTAFLPTVEPPTRRRRPFRGWRDG